MLWNVKIYDDIYMRDIQTARSHICRHKNTVAFGSEFGQSAKSLWLVWALSQSNEQGRGEWPAGCLQGCTCDIWPCKHTASKPKSRKSRVIFITLAHEEQKMMKELPWNSLTKWAR